MHLTKRRLMFGLLAIASFVTCVVIFLNPQWTFIRQHGGDAIAAFLVFCCLAIFSTRTRDIALGAFLIALGIELFQAFGLFVHPNDYILALLGHVFDWVDILMYSIGIAFGCVVDKLVSANR